MHEDIAGAGWKLHHLGIPVSDLDQAMADYRGLGIASFGEPFLIDSSRAAEYLVYGKRPDPVVTTRGVMGRMGAVGVELLQPLTGHTVHRELLEQSGSGVGHVAYTVDDLEGEASRLEAVGFPVILSITPAGRTGRSAVYIDTRGSFSNLIVELIQAA
ncbi:MAG: VOC family protein [Pseudomonadales bacterium]|jgi:catechol 2,3-dioxygenase-like lactoylglutathione lyase family enzyme|nr:VOC family protein [Pseudomonadales bacterium]MDP6470958.1 VOC family protein [Pseudomonadales bacterium]MDP6825857.1 VOC family protein [Pseudomonadales bacterium]MDP6972825.1 VOC family protein [Pseudomonadales bacterium]|tara:strand:- start:594 stop:1067 length:474 start_codon:yes stop_codon:yes gene_type:complete